MKLSRKSLAILVSFGSLAAPLSAVAQPLPQGNAVPATIGGLPSSAPVLGVGESKMQAAVEESPALPVTASERQRLAWLDAGHMSQMTVYDAAVAAEIAQGPWTLTSSETLAPPSSTDSVTTGAATAIPAVNIGTCWQGLQNQKTYTDPFGDSVTIDVGITGYCDGPGGMAIVARGNYLAGRHLSYPDSCNAAQQPYFHLQNANYYGNDPQNIDMLNTVTSGNSTPFGCVSEGENFAAADSVGYNGVDTDWNYIGGGWGQPGWGLVTWYNGPYTCCSDYLNN